MRILFCNYEYPPLGGGGGVINALLAQELAKRHDVTILTSQGLDLPRERIEAGVRVVRAPIFFRRQEAVASLLSMLAFIPMGIHTGRRLLRSHHFDVINTHFVLPTGPVGDALARFACVPNILSLHGGDLYDPSKFTSPHRHPLLRAWIKRLVRRSDMVVGQSMNTLDNLRRFYTPEIKGVRIPLGIQRPVVGAVSRERYGFRSCDVLLVTIGRLVARKAVGQLIAMMGALQAISARLLIVGTGPEENFLKEETRNRHLEDCVFFMGHVDEAEKFHLLNMSDLYVSTSQHEGFGLVFLEAMACGLPIVCYDHGGQTDFLRDGQSGYIIKLNDLKAFEQSCQVLIEHPALRHGIGENNRQLAEEFYIDRCALRHEAIFREVRGMHARRTSREPSPPHTV